MIIFGTRLYLYPLAILMLTCRYCGNAGAHRLTKRVTMFTLFFVPLFPVSTRYTTQCAFCGMEQEVPKEWAKQSQAQLADAPSAAGTYGRWGQSGA